MEQYGGNCPACKMPADFSRYVGLNTVETTVECSNKACENHRVPEVPSDYLARIADEDIQIPQRPVGDTGIVQREAAVAYVSLACPIPACSEVHNLAMPKMNCKTVVRCSGCDTVLTVSPVSEVSFSVEILPPAPADFVQFDLKSTEKPDRDYDALGRALRGEDPGLLDRLAAAVQVPKEYLRTPKPDIVLSSIKRASWVALRNLITRENLNPESPLHLGQTWKWLLAIATNDEMPDGSYIKDTSVTTFGIQFVLGVLAGPFREVQLSWRAEPNGALVLDDIRGH
jgi:hypothetical protein